MIPQTIATIHNDLELKKLNHKYTSAIITDIHFHYLRHYVRIEWKLEHNAVSHIHTYA